MELIREVARAPHGLDALASLLRYIFEVNEYIQRDELRGLLEREIGPQTTDVTMTIAQQLREEGIDQVRHRLQPTLLGLLRQRFGTAVTPAVEQRVAGGSIEQLETWISRVVSAATLAELLGD